MAARELCVEWCAEQRWARHGAEFAVESEQQAVSGGCQNCSVFSVNTSFEQGQRTSEGSHTRALVARARLRPPIGVARPVTRTPAVLAAAPAWQTHSALRPTAISRVASARAWVCHILVRVGRVPKQVLVHVMEDRAVALAGEVGGRAPVYLWEDVEDDGVHELVRQRVA